jgi:hypothetical protein
MTPSAASFSSATANFGKPPRQVFVIQLEEVKAEWRRRHPKGWGHSLEGVVHFAEN